ncbi:MAG: UDP-galactopyranose mutase, partial [Bacteroidota bacterium]
VNHPALDVPFTRVTEFKHATGQRIAGTTVAREFPEAYTPGTNEPYYPVPAAANRAQYARYVAEAASLASVTFAGRLADYKYYNMDQAVARALSVFERDLVPSRRS